MTLTARKTLKLLAGISLIAAQALPTSAQQVSECDWRAAAVNIAEPWEANTRTFANGKVRLALIDTVEPAAGAYYLLILSPPFDELGFPQCRLIGFSDGIGYAGMRFERLGASYDPARGLIFDLPAMIYLPEAGGFSNPTRLTITLNQASGGIGITQKLGGE